MRALLTTGGPRTKKLHGRYVEVYGPYQVMLNVDGISIYTRIYITTDSDQMGQIFLGQEELKVRRIDHDAMMEQDKVHIGYEADVTAHLLDTNVKKIGVTGQITGAVKSVMPIKPWERMRFTREDLIPTNLRLAAANREAIYVAGRTLVTVFHMKTDYEETHNLKRYIVKDCPNHADKDKILKRIDEFKSINKQFSMKSETDDGLSSCSNFPECPSSYELESDTPVLPEIKPL